MIPGQASLVSILSWPQPSRTSPRSKGAKCTPRLFLLLFPLAAASQSSSRSLTFLYNYWLIFVSVLVLSPSRSISYLNFSPTTDVSNLVAITACLCLVSGRSVRSLSLASPRGRVRSCLILVHHWSLFVGRYSHPACYSVPCNAKCWAYRLVDCGTLYCERTSRGFPGMTSLV